MQKKSQDFSVEEALRMAKSPAGQQLLSMLQQSDSGKLQQAIDQASAGNYSQASKILDALLSSSDAKKLLQQLEGK